MADTSLGRRELMRIAALIGSAGFVGWSMASPLAKAIGVERPPQAAQAPYKPQAFTASQFATLEFLCEAIIPSDDSPGARDASVTEFIDVLASRDGALLAALSEAITSFDNISRSQFGAAISRLSQVHCAELLTGLSFADPANPTSREHFLLIRDCAVMGYYTSEIGWRELNNPALLHAYAYEQLPGYPYTGAAADVDPLIR